MRAPLLTWTIAVLAMTNLAPGAPAQVSAPGPTTSTENATEGRQMPVSLEMNGKRRDLEIGTRTRTPAG